MRRNVELALQLLRYIEDRDSEGAGLYRAEIMEALSAEPNSKSGDRIEVWNVVDYQLRLLATAGFIVATPSEIEGDTAGDNFELTWSGHDYLDANPPSIPFDFNVGWL